MRYLLLLASAAAAPALAQSGQGNVAVTIYNDNLALVQDTRQLNPGQPFAPGIPRRLGADPPGDRDAERRWHRDNRAEFRL